MSGYRMVGYAAGAGLVLLGFAGLLADADQTRPLSWAVWFGGILIAHDLLLVPLVLATGVLTRRMRRPYRAALVIGAVITLVALPMVLGFGRRADNPSQLPLDYGLNLVVILAVIAAAGFAAGTLARVREARPPRPRG
ncbi:MULTISPECIES: hypothetical protein [Streptosporangium]|uniref:Lipoprotein n=1 Tax=Streptosporangium brasiliense TaxID=47480 RepID=A0ABT9R6F8_9ACTN|nr:hypothetical protein [Streptosporangium brasiliense]MDP9864823.1 hypothetical protein [Streptosporangium brasiliense]